MVPLFNFHRKIRDSIKFLVVSGMPRKWITFTTQRDTFVSDVSCTHKYWSFTTKKPSSNSVLLTMTPFIINNQLTSIQSRLRKIAILIQIYPDYTSIITSGCKGNITCFQISCVSNSKLSKPQTSDVVRTCSHAGPRLIWTG